MVEEAELPGRLPFAGGAKRTGFDFQPALLRFAGQFSAGINTGMTLSECDG